MKKRDNREQLAEAIRTPQKVKREQKKVKLCRKHPRPVHYDEGFCPACKAEQEFLDLTRDLEKPLLLL